MIKSLPFVYKSKLRTLVVSLLFNCLAFGFFGTFLGILGLRAVFTIFDLSKPSRLVVVLLYTIAIIIMAFVYTFRGRLRSIEVDDEQLVLTRLTGRTDTLARSDITQLFWRKQKILLQTSKQEVAIFTNQLPRGTYIVFSYVLLNWVPSTALPSQAKTSKEATNLFLNQIDPIAECFTAETEQKLLNIEGVIGFGAGLLVAGGVLYYVPTWFPCVSILFLLWSLIVLSQLSPKEITVDRTGIFYAKREKIVHTFKWTEIDAIEVSQQPKYLKVWSNGKYTMFSYSKINDQELDRLFDVLHKQALIHDVPLA